MAKIFYYPAALISLALALSGCSKSAKDLKLSEIVMPNQENAVLISELPLEDRDLLRQYMTSRRGKVDYTVKVGAAIAEQKKVKEAEGPVLQYKTN